MELPIQVAVRIFPCLPPVVKTRKETPPLEKSENDVNGNKCADALDDARQPEETPAKVEKLKDKEHPNGHASEEAPSLLTDDLLERLKRCCVHAIPIAATTPGYLNNVVAANQLPGQLDSNELATAGLIQVDTGGGVGAGVHTSFPVTHALRFNCTASQIYHQTVFPLICLFLEGFDASIVTYGQSGCGKTYTLYGSSFSGGDVGTVDPDATQGVVQRCVREIFAHMTNRPERTYAVNIGWVEIVNDDVIRDLLGVGNVHCATAADVFHWLRIGLRDRGGGNANGASGAASTTHTLFTLTLEQQWVTPEGLIQHRLSTASFSDLCGTNRQHNLQQDLGLQALEVVVNALVDPAALYGANGHVPYNRTTLTTLLKDSFGGRAQTLVLLCVSPLQHDAPETIANLEFAFKVQCVRNYVIVNTFSDDNTPVAGNGGAPQGELACLQPSGTIGGLGALSTENFGLHFAATQWCKLVSNAEGLFAKLMSSTSIPQLDKEQIAEWLYLKQECEECLSSSDAATAALLLRSDKQLVPIEETDEPPDEDEEDDEAEELDEPEETLSELEMQTSCLQQSSNDSDVESQRAEVGEQLGAFMAALRHKTDALVLHKYKQFIAQQPKAVMESLEEQQRACELVDERRLSNGGGRRRSIQPGASISSAELALLKRVATREQSAITDGNDVDDLLDSSGGQLERRAAANSPLEQLQRQLRKLDAEIEAQQRQVREIEATLQLKQNIITELVKNSETRSNAKQRFHKKKAKLETEYEKTKKQLGKALLQRKDSGELERLRAQLVQLEQRLEDLSSIKHIAGDCTAKLKRLQQSVHASKKLRDELAKKLKKERKQRDQLLTELRALQQKHPSGDNTLLKALGSAADDSGAGDTTTAEAVKARISHLDHVLREKTANLALDTATGPTTAHGEGLRHEIRNLRRTRDHLLEQRCSLDRKLKREKTLSQREERKLLECDEAIEAIDAAIEFKNELICGHKSIDTSERLQREKGEQMLMARLNKLSGEEMRTLLYKYFVKVIDLRDASRKLETQLTQLERERDAWEWKERVLSNAVRQARLEGERNAVLLQRQHEMKLTLMLRHLAAETSASSVATSYSDAAHTHQLALAHAQQHSVSSQYSDSEYDLDYYKGASNGIGTPSSKLLKTAKQSHRSDMAAICPSSPSAVHGEDRALLAKYKPSHDKPLKEQHKDQQRDTKHKLFAKFHVLTRYASSAGTAATPTAGDANDDHNGNGGMLSATTGKKKTEKETSQALVAIPPAQLKRLIATPAAVAKVTRQKNKIIIQDATRQH